ncbi:hypothetical protein [Aidingimonas lacisalsi]|uniref:hypothetical protein n=1 Tax=Aidingimonas lacisalsi TaxID=2604086 RepID=UPI0011D19B1A|nr:hypothetical protein [Aidingimonas lacisalsi]
MADIAEKAMQHEVTEDQLKQATATAVEIDAGGMADDYVEEVVFGECMQSSLVQVWAERLGFGVINDINAMVK